MGIVSAAMRRVPVGVLVPSIAWQYQFYEPELRKLNDFVPYDRGAVDVGMWWGPWSWWLARRTPRVDSFEINLELTSRITPVMPSNVFVHRVALSDRTGQADLWIPSGGTGSEGRASLEPGSRPETEWRRRSVATSRLDEFNLTDVGFIKMDVEGHELAVLHGASHLLETQRPTVLVEIEQHTQRSGVFDSVVKYFGDRSYTGEFLRKGRWHPIGELDRGTNEALANRAAQRGYGANLFLYARRYVHNFVFKPR